MPGEGLRFSLRNPNRLRSGSSAGPSRRTCMRVTSESFIGNCPRDCKDCISRVAKVKPRSELKVHLFRNQTVETRGEDDAVCELSGGSCGNHAVRRPQQLPPSAN